MNLRNVLVIYFSFLSLFTFSQQEKKLSVFFSKIKQNITPFSEIKGFEKLGSFFLEKNWDSTIVHTSRELNLGRLNTMQNDYVHFFRAYSFHKKSLFEQAKEEFSKVSEGFDFHDRIDMYLGEIASEQKEFEKAINYFKVVLLKGTDDLTGIKVGSVENNIALCYLHSKKYKEAENYFLKSIKKRESIGDTIKLINSYGNVANLYYVQYKDDQAIPYFIKAYKLSKEVKDFKVKRVAAKNMAAVEENRKYFAKALAYRKEYEQWNDSLNNQNRIYETAQLEKKIAVEQKQKEVTVLQAENKVKEERNKVYLYSGALLLVLLIILFTSYKGKVKRNRIITAQKEDLDELNATKDKLFSIVSHDLRSSVNAIKTSNKNLLSNLETDTTTDLKETLQQNSAIVNGAYGLLDNLLNWSLLQTKQSYFEITSLQLYTIVEHVAYNYKPLMQEKNIAFENTVDKKYTVAADQESLKIILRNLLDNAIKFSKPEGSIQVFSQEQEGYYDLIVEDSGIGMDELTINELLKDTQMLSKKKNEEILGTGLGLHLVKSMVKKNNGKFRIESSLGKGTKMIVSLIKSPPNG